MAPDGASSSITSRSSSSESFLLLFVVAFVMIVATTTTTTATSTTTTISGTLQIKASTKASTTRGASLQCCPLPSSYAFITRTTTTMTTSDF
jgi:archaellum component FlaG (FlaF/FlaG flagellin family)